MWRDLDGDFVSVLEDGDEGLARGPGDPGAVPEPPPQRSLWPAAWFRGAGLGREDAIGGGGRRNDGEFKMAEPTMHARGEVHETPGSGPEITR